MLNPIYMNPIKGIERLKIRKGIHPSYIKNPIKGIERTLYLTITPPHPTWNPIKGIESK